MIKLTQISMMTTNTKGQKSIQSYKADTENDAPIADTVLRCHELVLMRNATTGLPECVMASFKGGRCRTQWFSEYCVLTETVTEIDNE